MVIFTKNCDDFVAEFIPKYLEFMAEAVVCNARGNTCMMYINLLDFTITGMENDEFSHFFIVKIR